MKKIFATSLKTVSIATALCASASAAVTLDTLIDSAQATTIEPVTFRSLPVVASPEAICSLAGYQVATDFAKQPLGEGTEYYDLSGQGWGGTGFISSVSLGKMTVPKGGGGYYALKKVTCRRKVKSADIVFD